MDDTEQETRELDLRIRLARARLALDRGDTALAKSELRAAEASIPKRSDYYAGERMVLRVRIALRRGQHGSALAQLRDYFSRHGIELDTFHADVLLDKSKLTAIKISRGEVMALLAVAAHQQKEPDAQLLVRSATLAGVNMRALAQPRH